MKLARFDLLPAFVLAGAAGCATAHPTPDASSVPERPTARAPVDEVDLTRERTLIDEAEGALKTSDYAAARAKVLEATNALLSHPTSARGDAWLELLDSAGAAAWHAQDLRTASAAFGHVLEVRSSTLPEEHPDLQGARLRFAATISALGDLQGARVLEERVLDVYSRTLPEDHRNLQRVRQNLAVTIKKLGDLQGARALEERVLEIRARTLPEDHPDLQLSRQNLAVTLEALGDLRGARALEEKVHEIRSRTLPEEHPDLQAIRLNLASTAKALGDLAGARALEERVLEVYSRTLPEDHPNLQSARGNLATTLEELGDLQGARALEEQALEVFSRTLPADHSDLQLVRQNLAGTILKLGDLEGARVLYEKVLEVLSRTLPEDHPDLQRAHLNLAATISSLGDLAGARVLEEKVLEVRSRTLPDDHPHLQLARQNLAVTIKKLGDLEASRELFEKVLEVCLATLPEDHPDLQLAKGNLAATLHELGDLEGARELFEEVVEVRSRTLPGAHLDLQRARQGLATTIQGLGDLAAARELSEQVLEVCSRTLPEDHPDLATARRNLAATIVNEAALAAEGDEGGRREREEGRHRCEGLLGDLCRNEIATSRAVLLSAASREAEERCAQHSETLDLGLSYARGLGVFEPTPALETASFELSETTRGAALTAARIARRAAVDARYAERRAALARASEELASLVRRGGTSSADFERARLKRESAERELVGLAREVAGGKLGAADLRAADVSTALGEGGAAVSFRKYRDWGVEVRNGTENAGSTRTREISTDRLCAFVVQGAGSSASEDAAGDRRSSRTLTLVDLGPTRPIEAAVEAWRDAVGAVEGRGVSGSSTAASGDARRSGNVLRLLVFDPLLFALGESRRIVLVLDDVLHLIAFDALPLDESGSSLVGDRWRIETRATLTELLDPASEPKGGGSLLGVGGVSYDDRGVDLQSGEIEDGSRVGSHGDEIARILRGGAWAAGFSALPATQEEVEGIGRSFADAHGEDAEGIVLNGKQATKERLLAHAPEARFLHIATHGWFASESMRSWSDPEPLDVRSGLGMRESGEAQVRGMSPMLLCGLALAGANLPEDDAGRAPGLITAEEIAALDLSNCELAVLSACDTNVGERRGGQGVASLQKALHMAGARTVITSLWKVPDEATKDLMLDFYRRIWVDKEPKALALWEAKKRLFDAKDERGAPKYSTRDWAAWVLTGDPD